MVQSRVEVKDDWESRARGRVGMWQRKSKHCVFESHGLTNPSPFNRASVNWATSGAHDVLGSQAKSSVDLGGLLGADHRMSGHGGQHWVVDRVCLSPQRREVAQCQPETDNQTQSPDPHARRHSKWGE